MVMDLFILSIVFIGGLGVLFWLVETERNMVLVFTVFLLIMIAGAWFSKDLPLDF